MEESGIFFQEAFADVLAHLPRGSPRLEASGEGERLSLSCMISSQGCGLPVICRKELHHQSPLLPSPEEGPQDQRKPRGHPGQGQCGSSLQSRTRGCSSTAVGLLILIPRRHELPRATQGCEGPQCGQLRTTEVYCLTVLEAKIKLWAGHAPSEGAGERYFPDLTSGSLQRS